jgi:hypothetical protein
MFPFLFLFLEAQTCININAPRWSRLLEVAEATAMRF